jgi:hypothetical protein
MLTRIIILVLSLLSCRHGDIRVTAALKEVGW